MKLVMCNCNCHRDSNVMHIFPCCKYTYLPWSEIEQQDLNDILDEHGHVDNEFGTTYRVENEAGHC